MRKMHLKHIKVVAVGLIAVTLVGIGAVHAVWADSGTFYTDPSTESVSEGDEFTVNLYEDSDTQDVDTVNVVVNYDATKLQLVTPLNDTSGDPASVQTATASSQFTYFGGTYSNTDNGASSDVEWVGNHTGSSYTGKQLVGTVTFKALVDTGTTSIDLTGSNTAYAGTALDPTVTGTTVNFIDQTAPTISIDSPANNATVIGSTTVSTTASDNVGVTKVEFYVDGTLEQTVSSSPYNYTFDSSTLTAGDHTIKATAYDAAGNTTDASITVNVADQTAPTISIDSPANNATVLGTATITTTASDDVGVTKVEFYVDGTEDSTDTSSPYSYALDTTALTTGSHTIKATAYDAAGNTTDASITVNVADQTAPTVSITAPTDGSSQQGTVDVTADASDDVGVTGVDFYVDGTKETTVTSAPYTYSLDTTTLSNGSHTIKATANDAAGNSQSDSVTITVDNPDTTAPTISIDSPANNATVTGSTTVSTTASDNEGVAKVEFYIDGTLEQTVNSSPYDYTFDADTLSVGAHTIKATAYDAADNTTDAAISVTVDDTTPPTVGLNGIDSGDILNSNSTGDPYDSSSYPISVGAVDGSGIKQVEVKIDGVSQGVLTTAPYKYNIDLTGMTCGSHTAQAIATDNSANQNAKTLSVSFTVAEQGDLNGDCTVDYSDISILSSKYGETSNLGRADINGDDQVDFIDVSILSSEYVGDVD